jgi:hypothetical protein
MIFAVAASVLIVAGLTTWAILRPHGQQIARAVIDLRGRSIARGTEPPQSEPPLRISRNVSDLDILLPLGSIEGSYEVRVSASDGKVVFDTNGESKVEQGITRLPVKLNLSSAPPGDYLLETRKAGSEWSSFALHVQ